VGLLLSMPVVIGLIFDASCHWSYDFSMPVVIGLISMPVVIGLMFFPTPIAIGLIGLL
jgi:hypothetical protein